MNLAERFVQAAAKQFWEPEKQCAKNGECRGDAHDEMKMPGDEIVADGSSGEIVAREENPGESAGEKKRDETEREKHGGVELHASVPERAEPTDQKDGGRQSERKSQQRKGVHAAGEHVLAPNAKAEKAHTAQGQNNQTFLPNWLARKRGVQMRGEAKTREHSNVDFGLREKPKEALPKNWNSVRDDTGRLIGDEIHDGEKVRAEEAIGEQADARRQENAENQQAQDGVDKPGPHGQRQPGERHALSTEVDGRNAEIERVEK